MSRCHLSTDRFIYTVFVSGICQITGCSNENVVPKILKSVFFIIRQKECRLFFFLIWLSVLLPLFLSTLSSPLCLCHLDSMTIAILALGLLMESLSTLHPGLEIMVFVRIICFLTSKGDIFVF
jgi:hypothetical protein